LRKYKGRLKLGRWARVPLVDPELLWDHLVEGIATAVSPDPQVAYPRDFVVDTTSLLLLCIATSRLPAAEKAAIRDLLTAYGWRDEDGSEVDGYDMNFASPYLMLLGEIGPLESRGWLPEEHSDAAAALAREALLASHR
ncbi:MAG: plasmid pRiA4b ORF-3 family protein, partial [Corynebacterium variabile]|nr:plasmid pRiA4b ORF-3 family protein [Corynebacterium variabile]